MISLWRHYKRARALQSRQRYYWKVLVWDEHNQRTAWSEPAFWEMGLLARNEWQADWITPEIAEDKAGDAALSPVLRTEFAVAEAMWCRRALYATALGLVSSCS